MKDKKVTNKEKTSFYIDKDLVKRMKPFLIKTKKTDFINESIADKIEELEKEKAKKELLDFMKKIKPVKIDKSIRELILETRGEKEETTIKTHKNKR